MTDLEYQRLCGPHAGSAPSGPDGDETDGDETAEIALIRFPAEVVAPLRAICDACEGAGGPRPVMSPELHPEWPAALAVLTSHLSRYQPEDRSIDAAVLYRSEPGMSTVTLVDRGRPGRERLVGLHVDAWEGGPLHARPAVRSRLSINLSSGPRYFLFVNLPLADLLRRSGVRVDPDDPVTLFAAHPALRRCPDYPVVRVQVLPGEAYLAATGNLVHDGSSPPGEFPDIALHLLGHFRLPL